MLIYKGFDKDNTMLFMISGEEDSFIKDELDWYKTQYKDKIVRIETNEL